MLYKKQLFNLNELKDLLANENSCVTLRPTTRLLELPPCFLNDIKKGIFFTLTRCLKKYDLHLDGILIGYQKVKILLDERTGMIPMGGGDIRVNVSIEFFVFQPKIGGVLEGVVNKKGNSHVGCLVHKYFNASILKPVDIEYEDWDCKDVNVDDRIKFRVSELDFTGVVPRIEGVTIKNAINDNSNDPDFLGLNLPNLKDEDDDDDDDDGNYEKELLDSEEFWDKKLNKQNWMPDIDMNELQNEKSKRLKITRLSASPEKSDFDAERTDCNEIDDGDIVGHSHRKKKRKKNKEKNVSFLDEVQFMNNVDSGRKKAIANTDKGRSAEMDWESNIRSDLESSQGEGKSCKDDVEQTEKDQIPSMKKLKKGGKTKNKNQEVVTQIADLALTVLEPKKKRKSKELKSEEVVTGEHEGITYLNVNPNFSTPENRKKSKRKSVEVKDTRDSGEVPQILSPKKGCNDLSNLKINEEGVGNKAQINFGEINDISNEVQKSAMNSSYLSVIEKISSPKRGRDSKKLPEERGNSAETNSDVPMLSSSKKLKGKKHKRSDLECSESIKKESKKTRETNEKQDEGDSTVRLESATSPVLLQPSVIKKLKEGSKVLGKRTREPGDQDQQLPKGSKRKRLDFDYLPDLGTNELQMSLIKEAMKGCLMHRKEKEKIEGETSHFSSKIKKGSQEEKCSALKVTGTVDEEKNKKVSTPRSKTVSETRRSSTSKVQKNQKTKTSSALNEKPDNVQETERPTENTRSTSIDKGESSSDLIKSLTSQVMQKFTEWDSEEDNVFINRTPKQNKKTSSKTAKSLSLCSEKKGKNAKSEGQIDVFETPKSHSKKSSGTPDPALATPDSQALEERSTMKASKQTLSIKPESESENLVTSKVGANEKLDSKRKSKTDSESGAKAQMTKDITDTPKVHGAGLLSDVQDKNSGAVDSSHEKLIKVPEQEQLKSPARHEGVKSSAKKSKKPKKDEKMVEKEYVESLYSKLLQDALSNLNEKRSSSRERSSKKKKEKKHKRKRNDETLRDKEKKRLRPAVWPIKR